LPVPHALGDQAGFSFVEANRPLFLPIEIWTQEDLDCTLQEVQQLVLFGMHLPFVPNTRRLHRKDANAPPIEVDG
jgi:hypothetical protein